MTENLYKVTDYFFSDGNVIASVMLNKSHPIFDGHFPRQPVLPGVCQLRIIKELSERALNKSVHMVKADQIKFLSMIDPNRTPELHISIKLTSEGNETTAHAVISFGEYIFLKSKAQFNDA